MSVWRGWYLEVGEEGFCVGGGGEDEGGEVVLEGCEGTAEGH